MLLHPAHHSHSQREVGHWDAGNLQSPLSRLTAAVTEELIPKWNLLISLQLPSPA